MADRRLMGRRPLEMRLYQTSMVIGFHYAGKYVILRQMLNRSTKISSFPVQEFAEGWC